MTFDEVTYPDPAARMAAWRDAFSLSVDVQATGDETDRFAASTSFYALGSVLLADTRYTSHTVVRSRETIARTGTEQVVFDLFPEGGFTGVVGGRSLEVSTGDCFVMDMRGTLRLHLRAGRFVGLIMPRRLFDEAAGRPTNYHGLVMPADSAQAGFLGPMMIGLVQQAARLSAGPTDALSAALIRVVVASVQGLLAAQGSDDPFAQRSAQPKPPATLARLRRHIDRHAIDPTFDPDALASAFGLSRASLYRVFRHEGGVAEAIRMRRAALAFRALTQDKTKPASLAQVAKASGFPDVAALRRALRAVYGSSPARLQERPLAPDIMQEPTSRVIGALFDDLPS